MNRSWDQWTQSFSTMKNPFRTQSDVGMQPMRMYCKRCGKQLIYSTVAEDGAYIGPDQLQEEMTLKVCHKCYPVEIEELQKAIEKAQIVVEDRLIEDQFEASMKKYAEEMAKRDGSNPTADL